MQAPHQIDYLITGGTGLIGQAFIDTLQGDLKVVILSRTAKDNVTLASGVKVFYIQSLDDISSDDTIITAINLSGAPIADKPWSSSRKTEIINSRIGITEQLASLSRRIPQPFKLLISGSAIGYYGDTGQAASDESTPTGSDFAATLCKTWEDAASTVRADRTCIMRTGLVLSADGGLLSKLSPTFKLGLGATLGTGRQMMSWIHIKDVTNIMMNFVKNIDLAGVFNLTAPNPVSNQELSDQLARTFHKPRFLNTPTLAVKALFGKRASLLLDSQYVLPQHLIKQGYRFEFPVLDVALLDIYSGNAN